MFIYIHRHCRRGVQCTHPTANAEGDVFPIGKLELEIRARDGRENFKHFVGGTAGGGPVAVRDEAEPGLHQLGTPRSARGGYISFEVRGILLTECPFCSTRLTNIRGDYPLVCEGVQLSYTEAPLLSRLVHVRAL
jgi:hypothetical protein